MFGRRKREEAAAAEAERESERRALFARLAERPEHICPFLGLASDRTEFIEGISDEHRCFAFGEPAAISAEQQTRVCQERGYGNCPRYLRGVLVIPTEELEALRRPRPADVAPPPAPLAEPARRRRAPVLLLLAFLLLVGGGVGAFFLFGQDDGVGLASPTPSLTSPSQSTASVAPPSIEPTATAPASVEPTERATPSPEPTPVAGDTFAFYEVSVGPAEYTLFALNDAGEVTGSRGIAFSAFSFAEAEPIEAADGEVFWVTQNGDLAGWGYTSPESGEFRIRAVFLSATGERRSQYLDESQLSEFPEATPAP